MGWVIEVPPEIALELGVTEGSFAVLSAKEGRLEVEILPQELVESVRESCEQFKEAFDEMKRLGD